MTPTTPNNSETLRQITTKATRMAVINRCLTVCGMVGSGEAHPNLSEHPSGSKRTKAALAAAKGRGIKLGGQRGKSGQHEKHVTEGEHRQRGRSECSRRAKRNEVLLSVILVVQATGPHQPSTDCQRSKRERHYRSPWRFMVRSAGPQDSPRKSSQKVAFENAQTAVARKKSCSIKSLFSCQSPSQNCRWFVQSACATT
jgi:hypothetical protein